MYIVRVNVKKIFSKYRSKSYLQDYFGQGLSICIYSHYYNHAREILNSSLTF